MHEFARRYRLLRDGNQTSKEAWKSKKRSAEPDKFYLSFLPNFELVSQKMLEDALLAGAESGTTYAEFDFRYGSFQEALLTADRYLDEFFFPLQRIKVIGCACPVIPEGGQGRWFVNLFHEQDIPPEFLTTLTPLKLAQLIVDPDSYLKSKTSH